MNAPLADKLRGAARRIRAKFSPRAVILLYHRVADTPAGEDSHNLCVSPARFAEQMDVLKRSAWPVMELAKLTAAIADRRMPARSVVVTFDDGYADNLHTAKPILERLGVPATVFVATGDGGRGEEFYWDECEQLILAGRAATQRLRIGRRELDVIGAPGSEPRRRACVEACDVLREMPPAERREAMRHVRAWAGVSQPTVRPTHRTMTDAEIVQLASGEIVEVGAHTENHPALPSLSLPEQRDEIARSKTRLESILGRPVTSFAYPYGLHDAAVINAVRAAGFKRACSTLEHAARHASDELCLPRFDMGNCDGETFARKLRWAIGQ